MFITHLLRGTMAFSLLGSAVASRSLPVNLANYLKMDPHMLLGLINTELRNHCDSLEDLVKTHNFGEEELVAKLAAAGYAYQVGQNQFR
jgi:hypothetical protein